MPKRLSGIKEAVIEFDPSGVYHGSVLAILPGATVEYVWPMTAAPQHLDLPRRPVRPGFT